MSIATESDLALTTTTAPDVRSENALHSAKLPDGKPSRSALWAYSAPIMVGLVVRILVGLVWLGGTTLNNDAADYFAEATKLAQGTRGSAPFYWPPGTSYYLLGWFAVFGGSVTVARFAMIVLSTVQIAVVTALAKEATGRRSIAVTAAWLWAFYPPSVLLVAQTYSQHLSGLSLAMIALCGIKWLKSPSISWSIAWGLSLGVGCLTRPSMMSVLLVSLLAIAIASVVKSSNWRTRVFQLLHGGWLVLGAAIVLSPTILHNAAGGGGYSLSTNNERNFFLGNNPHTPWYKTSHFAQRQLAELPVEVQTYLKSHYEAPDRRAAMKQAAVQHILQNPGLAALRTANRARSFWGFDYLATRAIQATTQRLPPFVPAAVLFAEAGGYFAVMVLAIVGVIFSIRRVDRAVLLWYLAAIAAYTGPYCLAFASGTYHFPVMGIVIPFAAIGIAAIFSSGRRSIVLSFPTSLLILLFTAMQIEYGYYTLAAGISGSAKQTSSATE